MILTVGKTRLTAQSLGGDKKHARPVFWLHARKILRPLKMEVEMGKFARANFKGPHL